MKSLWPFFVALLLAACTATPPPPAQTAHAIALTTIAAIVPTTAASETATASATATATATATPSPSIIEVTVLGGEPTMSIQEVGTPINNQPKEGVFYPHIGKYTPNAAQRKRDCESLSCPVLGWLNGGQSYDMKEWILTETGQVWICLDFRVDETSGAEICSPAVLYRDPVDGLYGKVE